MQPNNNITRKIRSHYILNGIFGYLNQQSILEIIKYNKSLLNILNKNINDYIKEYKRIEIEIILKDNIIPKIINFDNVEGNSLKSLFENPKTIKKMNFTKFTRKDIKNMNQLFSGHH